MIMIITKREQTRAVAVLEVEAALDYKKLNTKLIGLISITTNQIGITRTKNVTRLN